MRLLEVGEIVKTHGIKGELRVKISTDDLSRFDKGTILYIGDEQESVVVTSSRMHQGMMLITVNSMFDINLVLKYVNKIIYCDVDALDNGDDIYYDDLIDCKVLVDGKEVGIVNDIIEVPQGLLLEINVKGKMKLVPYVDEFISDVDIDNKVIVITPIEGLL